ncbi:unnamed protein product [Linum tenue]|uniref:DNA2/NAM7 helicase helicase domain-containing protein n=1 Tax=Linum tenue TaxID=586396 RepID=A0AAV0NMF5_9ROSI|nr:unnamed protein product [Linum tenue]
MTKGGTSSSSPKSFSWRKRGVLSPIRTARHNTCVYRAFCDVADARARIMIRRSKKSSDLEFARFSAYKLWAREKDWAYGEGNRRLYFHKFYCNTSRLLPTAESSKDEKFMKYKLIDFEEVLPKDQPNAVEFVKESLKSDGPVMGGFRVLYDYLDGGPYLAAGENVPLSKDDKRRPPKVDDPYGPTQLSPEDQQPPEEVDPVAAKALEASKNPSNKRYRGHAVCIVGFCTDKGIDYFEVQESQGRLAWVEGFRKVSVEAFRSFYLPVLERWYAGLRQGVVYRLVAYRSMKDALIQLSKGVDKGLASDLVPVVFVERQPTLSKKDATFTQFNSDLDHSQIGMETQVFSFLVEEVPPGTGKITALMEIILQEVKRGSKILACAASNITVDYIVERLVPHRYRTTWRRQLSNDIRKEMKLDSTSFDLVIIDVAAQALEIACWMPLLKGSRCIFAGDHLRLPQTIQSVEADKKGLGRILIDRLAELYGDELTSMLIVQYSMH